MQMNTIWIDVHIAYAHKFVYIDVLNIDIQKDDKLNDKPE